MSRSPVVCHIDRTVLCCHYVIFCFHSKAVDGNGPSLVHMQFVTYIVLSCAVIVSSMCFHSAGSGWEWTISRSHAVCHIYIILYCPVLSSSHPSTCSGWEWILSPPLAVWHMHCVVLFCHAWCCCHLLFAISGSRWPRHA